MPKQKARLEAPYHKGGSHPFPRSESDGQLIDVPPLENRDVEGNDNEVHVHVANILELGIERRAFQITSKGQNIAGHHPLAWCHSLLCPTGRESPSYGVKRIHEREQSVKLRGGERFGLWNYPIKLSKMWLYEYRVDGVGVKVIPPFTTCQLSQRSALALPRHKFLME